jgi:hypothetical protein
MATGCGRPDCCAKAAQSAPAIPVRQVLAGYGLPLAGVLICAGFAQSTGIGGFWVATSGLLGLAGGAALAGRLSARSSDPIPHDIVSSCEERQ